ncbi:MAG: class I SAM-dependent methyltransferase, partial [bacterium]
RLIRNTGSNGPLLDIGCGAGQFLNFAKKQGWQELAGIEPVSEIARMARALTHSQIHEVDLHDTGLPSEHFAAIASWDVIEHLPRPRQAITEMWRILRPGGLLILSTPNLDGAALRFLQGKSQQVMPPEHLIYYARATMSRLIEDAGFSVLKMRSIHIYIREWTRKLARCDSSSQKEINTYKQWYTRLTGSSLFLGGMQVADVFLNWTNLGDCLVTVAQKSRSTSAGEDQSNVDRCRDTDPTMRHT